MNNQHPPRYSFLFVFVVLFLVNTAGCRDGWNGVPGKKWDQAEQWPLPTKPFGDQGSGGNPYNHPSEIDMPASVGGGGAGGGTSDTPSDDALPHVFVSGLQLYTCGVDPPQIELPRATPNIGCRMTAHVTPYWEDGDGNMEETDAAISWFSEDAAWATVNTPDWINDHALAWGLGSADLFDGDGVHEPETLFHACTMNDCLPDDIGCQPLVCTEPIAVSGVANLEGMWWFTTDTEPMPLQLTIFQDGRVLTIAPWLEQGSVNGANVSWSAEEEIFQGVLASRQYMSGLRWDEMGLNVIGTWEAWH